MLVTNFQKSPSFLRFRWSEVAWFGQIVFFQTNYDEVKFEKTIYDVISVTSSLLRLRKRHQTNVTKFFHYGLPNQKFWLRQCSEPSSSNFFNHSDVRH